MNKKIIALLLVACIAVSGVFAFGIGAMSSNITGYGSLTIAPEGHTGAYIGIGYGGVYGNNLMASFEWKFWEWYFIDQKVFNWGLQAGIGADLGIGFAPFSLGAGVYGFFGTNIYIACSKNFGIEFFGQWQPNIYLWCLPSFGVGSSWGSAFGAGAGGIRFWF